jgi:hypothetical protein
VHAHRPLGEHRLALLDRGDDLAVLLARDRLDDRGRDQVLQPRLQHLRAPGAQRRGDAVARRLGDRLVKADVGLALHEVVVRLRGGVLDRAPQLGDRLRARVLGGQARPAGPRAAAAPRSARTATSWCWRACRRSPSLTVRARPRSGLRATNTPPPGPRAARSRFARTSSRTASRTAGRLTFSSRASSASVPTRSPGTSARAAIACCSSCDTRSLEGVTVITRRERSIFWVKNPGILARSGTRVPQSQQRCSPVFGLAGGSGAQKIALLGYVLTWSGRRSSIRAGRLRGRVNKRRGDLMSEKTTKDSGGLNRADFLKRGGAAVGGVVLGGAAAQPAWASRGRSPARTRRHRRSRSATSAR